MHFMCCSNAFLCQIAGRLAVTGFHLNLCDLQTAPSCHMPTKSLILAFRLLRQRKPAASLSLSHNSLTHPLNGPMMKEKESEEGREGVEREIEREGDRGREREREGEGSLCER